MRNFFGSCVRLDGSSAMLYLLFMTSTRTSTQRLSFTTFAAGRLPQKTVVSYYTTRVAVEFPKPKDNELDLGHVMLSKAGQELAPLCETERHRDFLDYVVERWRKENLKVDVLRAEQGAAPNSDPAPP